MEHCEGRSMTDGDASDLELMAQLIELALHCSRHATCALIKNCKSWSVVKQSRHCQSLSLTKGQSILPVHSLHILSNMITSGHKTWSDPLSSKYPSSTRSSSSFSFEMLSSLSLTSTRGYVILPNISTEQFVESNLFSEISYDVVGLLGQVKHISTQATAASRLADGPSLDVPQRSKASEDRRLSCYR